MTEDKPDQPDFEKMAHDEIFKLQGSRPPFGHILRLQHTACKNGMERIWNDYVSSKEAALSAVKEENKQLRDMSRSTINEMYRFMCSHSIPTTEHGDVVQIQWIARACNYAESKSELSKKGEPINSELLATLKDAEKYCDDPEASKRFLAVIERAESTPLVKQSGDLWLIQRDGNSTEVFKNGERIEVPKDFDPLQLHLKTKSVEPVKSLQEEMLVILEEICETYPEYYDNPVGPYEYSCVFCSAMIGIKGGEPSVAMDDLPHQEHCTYTKAKTLLKKISPPIE
jgi:hypothetical protein